MKELLYTFNVCVCVIIYINGHLAGNLDLYLCCRCEMAD